MSTKESLTALKKTHEALKTIKETLEPFLDLLYKYRQQNGTIQSINNVGNSYNNIEIFQITEAEAAVALSIGTLRYMALRLKGKKSSDGKNDPLRIELDKMRKTLVELKKLKKNIVGKSEKELSGRNGSIGGKKRTSNKSEEDRTQSKSPKRQK